MRARHLPVLTSLPALLSFASLVHAADAPAAAAPPAAVAAPPPAAPPPAAPPPAAPPPVAAAPVAAPVAAPPAAPVAAPAPTVAPETQASASATVSLSGASVSTSSDVSDVEEDAKLERNRRLQAVSGIDGATGLLRTVAADGGGAGTFRVAILGNYYKGSEFLCPRCALPGRTANNNTDSVSQYGTRLLISATPVEFLEGYAALRYQSTSNDQGDPKSISIVGDTTLGVKLFTPAHPDGIFTFGGALDVLLLNSPGGVGLDAATGGLRALGTLDFTRRQNKEDRFPLRVNVNAGYYIDGSGTLANDVEDTRRFQLGHTTRITRIERFGHDIYRTDSFRTALGVEGVFGLVRPFAEWSLMLPVNRQNHECGNSVSRTPGDGCLADAGLSALPSHLTLGARFFPWAAQWLEGLAVTAAVDIGTGATSTFIEEVAPVTPWTAYLGIGWAVDTAPHGIPKVVEKIVEKPAAIPPERHIVGNVVQQGSSAPIPNAIVRYVGRPLTGMVADEQGHFVTQNLEPGEYRFTVSAEGYRDADCSAMVFSDAARAPAPGTAAAAPAPGMPAPSTTPASTTPPASGTAPGAPGVPVAPADATTGLDVPVTCQLEAIPRTATINGTLRDADTTNFVANATVTITDPLGRTLSLKTDAEGSFRFGNVPAGKSKIVADADGYLQGSTDTDLQPQKDVNLNVLLHARPKTPNVALTKTEIKLKKEVHFLHGSAEILPDSMSILEEAADLLRSHPEIAQIEIQGHTDDSGTPEINQRLSTDRANAVRQVLTADGVDGSRLTSHGYGQEKPLVPNSSDKNRAKNRRVQLMILP